LLKNNPNLIKKRTKLFLCMEELPTKPPKKEKGGQTKVKKKK